MHESGLTGYCGGRSVASHMSTITRIGAPYSEARFHAATRICADCIKHSKQVLPDWQPNALTICGKPVIVTAQCNVCERNAQSVVVIQATELPKLYTHPYVKRSEQMAHPGQQWK